MEKPTLQELTTDYVTFFGLKNSEQLRNLYSDTVSLIDWNGEHHGKDNVLNENANFFNNNTFSITLLESSTSGRKTFNKIRLVVNDVELDVMDVITFDSDDKIFEIKAYKG